jgi:hypothetical protein
VVDETPIQTKAALRYGAAMDPVAARAALQPFLRPGDGLLWTGGPDAGRRITKADASLIPFSVFFLAFGCFWEVMVITRADGAPGFFPVFGAVFIAIGLWMTIGRFWFKARRARATAYGLTSTRALIVSRGSLTEHRLDRSLLSISRTRDGAHLTLRLAAESPGGWWRTSMPVENTGMEVFSSSSYTNAFHDVPDVHGLLVALDSITADPTARRLDDRRG